MGIEIIIRKNPLLLFGYAGKVHERNFPATGWALMDKLWKTLKLSNLRSDGINYWIYEKNEMLFTGTALAESQNDKSDLEAREIAPGRYAFCKHTGPYSDLSEVYTNMETELVARGFSWHLPFIEIYGQWTPDESKLETEIHFSLD